jgi:flagellar basal-body rod protein FlgC
MTAERLRMEVHSDNLANANSTRTEDGGPYRKKTVVLEPRDEGTNEFPNVSLEEVMPGSTPAEPGEGVRATDIKVATDEPRRVYKPEHPDANEEGYVMMPDIDPVTEMVDMLGASRAYEANVSAIQSAKSMYSQGLQILQ